MKPHLLRVVGIEDEGNIEFEIECPAGPGERCPYDSDPPLSWYGDDSVAPTGFCWVREEFAQVGTEIIRGVAHGPGPWPIELKWAGSGEDSETWIDLLPEPTPAAPIDAILSV